MRVVIAEDSVLLREGLVRLLGENDLDVVDSCQTAHDLLLKVRSYSSDVAIVDIRLPPTHNDEGLQAVLKIRARHPDVGVLVLSQYVEVGLALKLLADSAEGVGYLLAPLSHMASSQDQNQDDDDQDQSEYSATNVHRFSLPLRRVRSSPYVEFLTVPMATAPA